MDVDGDEKEESLGIYSEPLLLPGETPQPTFTVNNILHNYGVPSKADIEKKKKNTWFPAQLLKSTKSKDTASVSGRFILTNYQIIFVPKCEYEEEFGTQDVASEQEIDARKRSRSKTEEKLSDKSAKQNSINSSKSISSDSPTSGSHRSKHNSTGLVSSGGTDNKAETKTSKQEAVFGLEKHIYIPLLMIYKIAWDQKILEIFCKDFRIIYFSFEQTRDLALAHLKAYFPTSHTDVFAHSFAAQMQRKIMNNKTLVKGWSIYDPERELRRILNQDEKWRISAGNNHFELCDSYPQLVAVPASISDDVIHIVKDFRFGGRFPVLSWRHPLTAATITCCSQPKAGLRNTQCKEDKVLLREVMLANQIYSIAPSSTLLSSTVRDPTDSEKKPAKLTASLSTPQVRKEKQKSLNTSSNSLIMGSTKESPSVTGKTANNILPLYLLDVRTNREAITNQATGGGFEDTSRYKHTKLKFLQIPNSNVMRESVRKLQELTKPNYNKNYETSFLTALDSSHWLEYIGLIIKSSLRIAKLLDAGINVTVHCSDGRDRTAQLSSVAMVLLDPYYRTIEGFIVLIEKEWLAFGHKFESRCGHIFADGENETAPIFLQFMDCVWQLMQQFPSQFEFNSKLLILILDHANSGLFGTFLCNSLYRREQIRIKECTISLWTLVYASKQEFTSSHYINRGDDDYFSSISSQCCCSFLQPNTSMRCITLWKEYYFRFDRAITNSFRVQDTWNWCKQMIEQQGSPETLSNDQPKATHVAEGVKKGSSSKKTKKSKKSKKSKISASNLPEEEKDFIIQSKEEVIRQKDAIIHKQMLEMQEKDTIIQSKEATIKQKDETIQHQLTNLMQKSLDMRANMLAIQQKDAEIKQRDELMDKRYQDEEQMRSTKKKWKYLAPEIEEMFKSNFYCCTKNENWKSPADFEIVELISGGRGAFNVGVFKITSNMGECAMKIIDRTVEDTPENVEQMYRNTQITKLDKSETSIPFAFAFPTMVPLLNHFIGDLKMLDDPSINQKRQVLEGTNARLINKTTFLVMPVYDGTLESFWKRFQKKIITVSLEDEYFVIYQCLLTLEHFKVNRIIHGDFRPANIFIFLKPENANNFLRIGVGDFGLAKCSAKNIQYNRDKDGNPFNNYYVPPEVAMYRPPPENKKETFWDLFEGYDCWSLGKSIIELYCVKNIGDFNTTLKQKFAQYLRDSEEFQKWLREFIRDRMTEELKIVCLILMDINKRNRQVGECLLLLGVHIWVVPELRKQFGENWRTEKMETKKAAVVKLFDTLADSLTEDELDKLENWRSVARIHWFAKNRMLDEEIFAFL